MSQRDEKDLFQNEKTGQGYGTERGGKKKKEVSDAERRRSAVEVEWCAGARTDKAEPGAAGELGVCQPSSQ